jgi:hypothetical protein
MAGVSLGVRLRHQDGEAAGLGLAVNLVRAGLQICLCAGKIIRPKSGPNAAE